MAYLGIDPGLHGAWALLSDRGDLLGCSPLPVTDGTVDPARLADQWRACPPVRRVALELVHAMPGQGVSSMFSFGETTGIILGVLGALGHFPARPTPQRWQKALGVALPAGGPETDKAARRKAVKARAAVAARRKAVKARRKAVKARAAVAAAQLLGLDAGQLVPKGCRTVHDGLVDAVCIAEWLRREEPAPWLV